MWHQVNLEPHFGQTVTFFRSGRFLLGPMANFLKFKFRLTRFFSGLVNFFLNSEFRLTRFFSGLVNFFTIFGHWLTFLQISLTSFFGTFWFSCAASFGASLSSHRNGGRRQSSCSKPCRTLSGTRPGQTCRQCQVLLALVAVVFVLQIFDDSHVVAELLVGHVRGVNPQGVEAGPNALEVFRVLVHLDQSRASLAALGFSALAKIFFSSSQSPVRKLSTYSTSRPN